MRVQKDSMVSIHYTMTLENGETVHSTLGSDPVNYLHGYGNIVIGLEEALEGASVGASFQLSLSPAKRGTEFSADLVKWLPRSAFADADTISVGMSFMGETEDGPRKFFVKAVTEEEVEIDGNHPLAGQTIHYSVSVEGLRESTPAERENVEVKVENKCPNTGCCN